MHGKSERRKIVCLILIVAIVAIAFFVFLFVKDIFGRDQKQQLSDEVISEENMNDTLNYNGENIPEEEQLLVVNAYVNEENHLIMVYSNGKEIDTGAVETTSDDVKEQFKVVFQDADGAILKEEFVSEGASATPPVVPQKEGCIFVGWNGSYTKITTDTTLIAMHLPMSENAVKYIVRFVDYDDVVLKTETVLEGCAATAPGIPLRKGYEFTGWDKAFDKVSDNLIVKAQYEVYSGPEVVIDDVEASGESENIAVTLRLKNNPGVASLKFAVTYSDYLTLTKVEYNPELGGHSLMPQTLDSPATLIWVNPFEDKSGDWLFATLYFTVTDNAEGTLPITVTYDPNDVYNIKETNVKFRVSNGAINVRG